MTDAELLEKFSTTLTDIIGGEPVVLTLDTTRQDVDGWDSFSYINFIAAIEIEFDVKFGVSDVESFTNVGDIVNELKALQAD